MSSLLVWRTLVVAVLLSFFGHVQAGQIVASAIPLSMLIAFTGMVKSRSSANLMSLGAIDFGLIVDGVVVLVENIVRRLSEPEGREHEPRFDDDAARTIDSLAIVRVAAPGSAMWSGHEGRFCRKMPCEFQRF